jgi:phage/plasmid-like protein (TIGR03299 family)
MATASAQVWQSLGTKRPGEDGYRPDRDANFNGDFIEYASPARSKIDSGFYVGDRGLPWHVTLARALGERELMHDAGTLLTKDFAVKAAGGDFDVILDPAVTQTDGLIIPRRFATIRTDTNTVLGSVGAAYKVFQNRDLAALADAIVETGEAKYETGGLMRGGAVFFLSMELDHLDVTVPGDTSGLRTYLLLVTSHDGSRPAGFYLTQVRTVCRNTQNLATKNALRSFKIRHVGDLAARASEAQRTLGIAAKDSEHTRDVATTLATSMIVDAQIKEIFETVWPVEEGTEEPVSRNARKAFDLYESSPTLDGIRGTKWAAYNAVTEYLDHYSDYRGGSLRNPSDRRAESLLFGPASRQKALALRELLKV